MNRALFATLLLVTACGTTTVPSAGSGPAADSGLSAPSPADGGLGPGQPVLPEGGALELPGADGGSQTAGQVPAAGGVAGPAGSGSAAVGPTGGLTGTGAAGGAGTPGRLPHSGPGVSASTITIGLARSSGTSQASAVAEGVGANGFTEADGDAVQDALVRYFNKRGGIGGRQLKSVYHTYDNNSSAPFDQQAQEACATYTEDDSVFAVIEASNHSLQECLSKRGRLVLDDGQYPGDAVFQERVPGLVTPIGIDYTQMARTYVDSLVASGFLRGGNRIGVQYVGSPQFTRAYEQGLLPALRRAGLKPTKTFVVRERKDNGDTASAAAEVQASVLQFREADVDRVIWVHNNGAAQGILFMRQAESQGYRPLYGLTSLDFPQAGLVDLGAVPREQLVGSVAIGWRPAVDVSRVDQGGRTAAAKRCLAALASEGVPPPDSTNAELGQLNYCESFFVLEAAVARATTLSFAGVLQGLSSLGATYRTTQSVNGAAAFGPGKRDGVSVFRASAFREQCGCYRWVSGDRRLAG